MRMININQEASDAAEQFGAYLEPELHVTSVPRGRSGGLFVALAGAVCSIDKVRSLPVISIDELARTDAMFDYDPAEAIDLDIALG